MEESRVRAVAKVLANTEMIPLPAGHGVRLPNVRDPQKRPHCGEYVKSPGAAARSYVCLGLLAGAHTRSATRAAEPEEEPAASEAVPEAPTAEARGPQPIEPEQPPFEHVAAQSAAGWEILLSVEAVAAMQRAQARNVRGIASLKARSRARGEMWMPGDWLKHATDCFYRAKAMLANEPEPQRSALDGIGVEEAWSYVLAAEERLVASSELPRTARDKVRFTWFEDAFASLKRLVRQRRGNVLPSALAQVGGHTVRVVDARWKKAAELLAPGERKADLVQALYFLHVFHASVGLWQADPDVDDHYESRRRFYGRLRELLLHCIPCGAHRYAADRIARALGRLPLFSTDPDDAVGTLSDELPACFGLYNGDTPLPLADVQSQVEVPAAKYLLAEVHRLAELVADILLDPLHVRLAPESGPGFMPDDYGYLDSRMRHHRHGLRSAPGFRLDMSTLFRRMDNSVLVHSAQSHLAAVHTDMWPGPDAEPRCALHHVQAY